MVKRDVSVATGQTRKQRSEQAEESIDRFAAKRAEEQIEPHDIGFQLVQSAEQSNYALGIVKRPAAQHGKVIQFRLRG